MMNALKRTIVVTIGAAAIILGAYISYLWVTYIDDVVTSGTAYGFNIGEDMLTVYKKMPASLLNLKQRPSSTVYFEARSDVNCSKLIAVRPGYRVLVEAILHEEGFSSFKEQEQWEFYFDGSYFNKISLTFCGDKLCQIYRHRKYFELP